MAEQDPMQVDNSTDESGGAIPYAPPALLTQPHGLETSSGQLTAVFTLFCMIAALVGFHFTQNNFQAGSI